MRGELLYMGPLASDPLEAAADFHARLLPSIEATLMSGADPLTIVFEPADSAHRAWRLAAVQGLARRFAPARVNALAGAGMAAAEREALEATAQWLRENGGITGQLLALDGTGVPSVL